VRQVQRNVLLVIKRPGNECDRTARNQFADEHDSPADLVPLLSPHIKAKIHFLEIRVHRNRQKAEQFCFEKSKTDETDEDLAVPAIKFGSCRNEREKQARLNFIVQHRQMLPLGAKENSFRSHVFKMAGSEGPIQRMIMM
jgi:hypothetical protein